MTLRTTCYRIFFTRMLPLPHEARRRDADLERQIKHLKGASGAQQIDQVAVERAVKSAVERERVTWQRKLEQGRTRFCQLTAAAAWTRQSFEKVKELLEDTESEWLTQHAADAAPAFSGNHRPERGAMAMTDRLAATESLDGPFKLAAGERRILTALAQYPQGREQGAGGGFDRVRRDRLGGFNRSSRSPAVASIDQRRWGESHHHRGWNSGAGFMGADSGRRRTEEHYWRGRLGRKRSGSFWKRSLVG